MKLFGVEVTIACSLNEKRIGVREKGKFKNTKEIEVLTRNKTMLQIKVHPAYSSNQKRK